MIEMFNLIFMLYFYGNACSELNYSSIKLYKKLDLEANFVNDPFVGEQSKIIKCLHVL